MTTSCQTWLAGSPGSTRPAPLTVFGRAAGVKTPCAFACARHFAGEAADEATMTAVDRLGFRLRIRSGERLHGARIAFPREVRTAADSRTVLIEMLAQARAGA